MPEYTLKIKPGKELTQPELKIINDARVKHFNSKSVIQLQLRFVRQTIRQI